MYYNTRYLAAFKRRRHDWRRHTRIVSDSSVTFGVISVSDPPSRIRLWGAANQHICHLYLCICSYICLRASTHIYVHDMF